MLFWISVALGLMMAAALFRLFFKDFADFIDCLRYWFQPDIISMFRGEWQQDMWATLKLAVWGGLSCLMGLGAFYKLPHLFPKLAGPPQVTWESPSEPVNARQPTPAQVTNPGTTTSSNDLPVGVKHAADYGVRPGDTVDVSALKPAVMLRRASLVTADEQGITVKTGSDRYTIRWSDITRLRPSQ
jgi:hypothetical protein